jgi:hypothetical protein
VGRGLKRLASAVVLSTGIRLSGRARRSRIRIHLALERIVALDRTESAGQIAHGPTKATGLWAILITCSAGDPIRKSPRGITRRKSLVYTAETCCRDRSGNARPTGKRDSKRLETSRHCVLQTVCVV